MSPIECVGAALGLVMAWLLIIENIWAWPVGLIDSAIYVYIFFSTKLYSDTILQGVYCVIFGYGWWHWWRGRGPNRTVTITRLSPRGVGLWLVFGAAASLGWGEFMHRHTDAALPRWDAFVLVFSLIAQWWQARKRFENWVAWMVVDAMAIGVYWAKDLKMTSYLYSVYFAMAVAGHIAWKKSMGSDGPGRVSTPR